MPLEKNLIDLHTFLLILKLWSRWRSVLVYSLFPSLFQPTWRSDLICGRPVLLCNCIMRQYFPVKKIPGYNGHVICSLEVLSYPGYIVITINQSIHCTCTYFLPSTSFCVCLFYARVGGQTEWRRSTTHDFIWNKIRKTKLLMFCQIITRQQLIWKPRLH